ncbi:MAG: hypothetical protein H6741_11305 [Alphaproteobacteria bacterium]|nr:hypothetical protein [Alphaproteobacteria bacterium]
MTRLTTLALVLLAACGSKETSNTAAPAEAASDAPAVSSDVVPADKASQAFAEKLFALTITDFRPIDSSGADFIYKTFQLKPDGQWNASGVVEIAGETMECRETGPWTMDPAESNETANVTWTIDETNCAGRESGTEHRIQLTIRKGGEYEVSFR